MKDPFPPSRHDGIVREACAWLAQLETGELSAADIGAFREWVESNPAHGVEIRRLAALSADMNMLLVLDESMQDELAEQFKLPVLQSRSRVEDDHRARRSGPLYWAGGLAASLVLAAIVSFMQFQPVSTNGLVTTPVGGYLEKELEDGTVIKVNTDTGLTVAYDDEYRKIQLHRGEVFFQVKHDADRPLVVSTDTREVVALGTAFSVRVQDEYINVLVTEGSISIGSNAKAPDEVNPVEDTGVPGVQPGRSGAPIVLEAGQVFDDMIRQGGHPVTNVTEAEQQRSLAWQRGLAEFTDAPLAEVVREVSRYTLLKIRVEDDLRNVRFGGIFPTGEPRLLFEALETTYGISVTYLDDSSVLLAYAVPQAAGESAAP